MIKRILSIFFLFFSVLISAQSFDATWNTENISSGSSPDNEIIIPTNPAFTNYNYTVDWGDGLIENNITGDAMHNYAAPGIYPIKISGVFPAIYFNNTGDKLKIIEISQWGTIPWETMEEAFHGCENLNFDAIAPPDLSRVTSLKNMFRNAVSFNGIMNNWDVSTITDISGLFAGAILFNRPLDNWTTNSITDMSWTFSGARNFNEPLDNWNTNSVITMEGMFSGASSFSQNINNWNVISVTNMASMFRFTNSFNISLNNWNVTNVTNMSQMFEGASYNLPLDNWNVGNVTDMSGMFSQYSSFNQNINNWDVSSVTNMSQMFHRATVFNQPLDNWVVTSVTDMSQMFDGFIIAMVFNQPLNTWDVSNVTNMKQMFRDCMEFNQPLDNWIVDNVTDMSQMFEDAQMFDQDLSGWNVGNVTNMTAMFQEAETFNQPLNTWTVTNVTLMSSMFNNAIAFNQPLDNWIVDNVTNMSSMFNRAETFNQDISGWTIENVTAMTNMLDLSGLSQENYDALLLAWAQQDVSPNINLGARDVNYCDGRDARQELIDDHSWTFTDDQINCDFVLCANILSPIAGDMNVPNNFALVWEPVNGATGYRVSVRREFGGGGTQIIADDQDFGNVTQIDFVGDFTAGDMVFMTVVPYNDTSGPATGCQEFSVGIIDNWRSSPDALIITYDTRLTGFAVTPMEQLEMEINPTFTYDYSIDWGDNQFNNNVTEDIIHTYRTPGIYTVAIIGNYPALYHGTFGDGEKIVTLDQWGTQEWQSLQSAFYNAENMTFNSPGTPNLTQVMDMSRMFLGAKLFNFDINNWDVSNVTNMESMFLGAIAFNQPLNTWNVLNVTDMTGMFFAANAFDQAIDNWDVDNVTSMRRMFGSAVVFNQPLNSWNTANVTDMEEMFNRAELFDQDLNNWNVGMVTTMEDMFEDATAFNGNISNWDVSQVTIMQNMFRDAEAFDQPINSWNVGNVLNMSHMFHETNTFNQPINDWNVSAVTTMQGMFETAIAFNQPLDQWNVEDVVNMEEMFSGASVFNQNIDSWNVTSVITMESMFQNAIAYNQPLNSWDVNSVVNMESMFRSAEVFNQPLGAWDVSAVATMSSMFQNALVFNQDISGWDVSSVTLMSNMFNTASAFNSAMNNWNVASVTTMQAMFKDAILFNNPLNNWDTGEVLTTAEMFSGAAVFDQNIDSWDVSFVRTMEEMFKDALAYNQTMDSWNVASVTSMKGMFQGAIAFNGSIENWNVRAVTTMENMFFSASNFNQALNNWRISGVTNMNQMFALASAFNQPLDLWNPGAVSMNASFEDATAFDQYLGDWDVSNVNDMGNMLDDTALTRENYDNTLIAWSAQTLTNGINLGARGLLYCDALEERQSMIDTYAWSFSEDILDCPIPLCTQLVSPINGATDVPVNTNLTWDPSLYARGYRLTIRIEPGSTIINETITNNTSYAFASDFVGGETVFVTITPFNDTGDAVSCTEESFTIAMAPADVPDCTNLTSPIDTATDIAIDTDLSWSPIANADGYFLTVGTSTGANDLVNNEDVGNTTNYDFTADLPEDTDIFVTITPYNAEGNASSCVEESFKTELIPVPPSCTVLNTPTNGATDIAIDTNISWDPIAEATGYLVIVGTTSGGVEIVNNVDVGNMTTYDIPDDLRESRTYYVTIIPYNDEGDATGCTEETFRTGDSTSPPSCVVLTSPADGTSNVALDTNLSWGSSATATGYRLTVGTTMGGSEIFTGDVGTLTTYDLAADLPEGTQIYVNVIAYNDNGDASGCAPQRFTTVGPPACTSLTTPTDGATDVAIDTNLEWTAVADADGYKLTVTAGSSTLNNIADFDITSGTTYAFPSDFEQGETVTVTIIPYNATGDAVGCSAESFTIKAVPTCTTLATPTNGAIAIDPGTAISWNAVASANGYLLNVNASSSTANNISDFDITSGTTYTFPNDFEQGETVTVTITPYNEIGNAIGCTSESFTIKSIPNCTSLSAPVDGSVVPDATEIQWNAVTGANGYRVSISGSINASNDITDFDTNATNYSFANPFEQGEVVTVQITPYNELGNAVGCTSESFTILPLPECTALSTPLNGATQVAVSTDISWNASANADGYRITVGTSPNGNDIVADEDVASLTTYTFGEDLPSETLIYVTITPYNSSGDALACNNESFETDIVIPACSALVSPSNGETNVALAPTISWNEIANALGYRISIGTNSDGNDIVDDLDMGLALNYTHTTEFPIGTQINVRITPYNSKGDATACDIQSFTTLIPEDNTKYGFSPDGDGINEYWHIENIELYPENTVTIFNRWGDVVFEMQGYNNNDKAFYGTANRLTKVGAGELPEGTYFFKLDISGEHNLNKLNGYLILKR